MTYDIGNPSAGSGHTQKCVWVKPVDGLRHLLISEYPYHVIYFVCHLLEKDLKNINLKCSVKFHHSVVSMIF
jgi:hypothetical protein